MINRVTLVGRVGQDPMVKYTGDGLAIANTSLATSQKVKGQEETQWHRLVFFGKLAEIVSEYVVKGTLIYVEGTIKYGKYTDKEGFEKNTVDIICSSMTMLGGKSQAPKDEEDVPF
ncbi:MAG: single-stranded DNA-binding protein [Proteobacteria bacterium]|nr:single-stranded DNA-binding protein [Pseudomonadota bacterium]